MSGEVGRFFEEDVGFSLPCIASVSFDGKVGRSCGYFDDVQLERLHCSEEFQWQLSWL